MAKLIQIAGNSGSGKTTIHSMLNSKLRKNNYNVIELVEPGPLSELAKQVRSREIRSPWTEAAIFSVDRLLLYQEKVFSQIDKQNLIFTSARSYLDTIVYQGLLGGVDVDAIIKMNSYIPKPDLAVCLVVEGNEGYSRILKRYNETGKKINKSENPETINILKKHYESLPNYFSDLNIKIIDTSKSESPAETFNICYNYVKGILNERLE